eukprot:5667780-Pyramimonas_sp.AAC.1
MLKEHASELERQALNGNFAGTFKIVRMLSRGGVRGNTDVKLDSGVLSASADDRDLAWLQHYSRAFQAEVKNLSEIVIPCPGRPPASLAPNMSPEATYKATQKLAKNKGVGCDGAPAELLQAGEWPLAFH